MAARQTKAAKLHQSQIVTIRVRSRSGGLCDLPEKDRSSGWPAQNNSAALVHDHSGNEFGDADLRAGLELPGEKGNDQANSHALAGGLAHGDDYEGPGSGFEINFHGHIQNR